MNATWKIILTMIKCPYGMMKGKSEMKNPKFRPAHKQKEQTLNAAPDTHKKFCERCWAYNNVCIMTKRKTIDKDCAV